MQMTDGAFELHKLELKTGEDKVLVRKEGYQAFFPAWSPYGKHIAFTRDISEGTGARLPALFMVDLEDNECLISNQNSFD